MCPSTKPGVQKTANPTGKRSPAAIRRRSCYCWLGCSLFALLTMVALTLSAFPDFSQAALRTSDEPYNTGWSFQVDNDLLAGRARDQDYTGGIALTLSGQRVTKLPFTPQGFRAKLDRLIGIDDFIQGQEHFSLHALEFGTALFTPTDIGRANANPLDRPYSSLFYLNNTRQLILPGKKLSIKSGLTIGLLGLQLADTLQSGIHGLIGAETPRGWDNQISQGGEPTAKYSLGLQRALYQRLYNNGLAQELNGTGKVDVGFTTGVGAGFNWRFGRINTPWWTFNPHQSEYINLGANVASGTRVRKHVRERYVYLGSTVNYNVYNALVEGQFRESAVTVDRSNVNSWSAEVWGGLSVDLGERLRLDMFLRSRTRDVELPESDRLTWGGITFSRVLG